MLAVAFFSLGVVVYEMITGCPRRSKGKPIAT